MNNDWASEQLQTIRILMERSAIYRRALAPVMVLVGAGGVLAGLAAYALKLDGPQWFIGYWGAVAILVLFCAMLLIRRQAFQASEPFWTPPTRRVVQAMILPLFIAAVLSVMFFLSQNEDEEGITSMMVVWMIFYGFAANSAGFFVRRGIRLFGWFMALGGVALGVSVHAGCLDEVGNRIHLLMSAAFGLPHLGYGLYLYFTEKQHQNQ